MYLKIKLICFILLINLIEYTQEYSYILESTKYSNKKSMKYTIDCKPTPNLPINAMVMSSENTLLIFYNSSQVAVTDTQKLIIPSIKKIIPAVNLIPRLEGHIESAFTYENVSYFLNNYTQIWNYDQRMKVFMGPYERSQIFGCLNSNYTINSILTIQKSKRNALMLIYHTENDSQYITFCDLHSNKTVEKYQRYYKTDAIDIIWKSYDRYEGISVYQNCFSYFEISAYLGNLRYQPMIQPLSDNQLLLGCPQQICIDGKIDAILTIPSGKTLVFRGKYFWEFSDRHLHNVVFDYDSVKLVTDYWPELPPNLDTAFSDKNWIYFFKDESLWKYRHEINNNTKEAVIFGQINGEFPKIPYNLDSVYYNENNSKIFFIKGHNFYVFDTNNKTIVENGEIIPILNNQKRFTTYIEINAIHEDDAENLLLFSNNFYFSANISSIISGQILTPRILQEDLFNCFENYNYSEIDRYKNFVGFKLSISQFIPLNITFLFLNDQNSTIETKEPESTESESLTTESESLTTESTKTSENNNETETEYESFIKFLHKPIVLSESDPEISISLLTFIIITLAFTVVTSIIALLILAKLPRKGKNVTGQTNQ